MKLKLLEFIKNNKNWEELLSQKPYCLSIKRDDGYILFMYNQIDSDMSNPIVQESRGIIFWEETMFPVCVPFFKFFNVQETQAAEIDWSTAEVQEKLDGSIIKLWYHKFGWNVSTNGTIHAINAELKMPVAILEKQNKYLRNYMDLFIYANQKRIDWYNSLDKGYTYIFELVSPYNRVVVPYKETKLYHIGSRNNYTLMEEDLDIGIEKPRKYNISTLEECLKISENLPFDEEGYVVVDSNYNRVKIKSHAYVVAHHLKNNGVVTYSKILDLIKLNEGSEFLSYYPEYKDAFDMIKDKINYFIKDAESTWENIMFKIPYMSRKDFALWAGKHYCPPVFFSLYDGKHETVKEWLYNQKNEKILKWIGVKE